MAGARRGQWPVVAIHGSVAVTVLALVAVLALVVKPPAPPGIAAFAPQAAKPISKAPPGQSSQFGNGPGQCAAGLVCAGPSATPSGSLSASASPGQLKGAAPAGLQCQLWPDGSLTQTFDPQSPPCISTWDDSKGNGGATSPGVTGSEIRVAFPVDSSTPGWPGLKPFEDFFNSRFQLYGRKITIVPVPSKQASQALSGGWNDPVAQRADAAQIAQSKVFATLDFIDPIPTSWTLPVFLDTMAKHKIVAINGGDVTPYGTAKDLEKRAPYAWSYYAPLDQVMRNVATMACRQLVGKKAIHASSPELRDTVRKFAFVLPSEDKIGGPMPGLSSLLGILEGCGVRDVKLVRYQQGTSNHVTTAATMQELANDGVTSVFFLPFGGNGQPSSPLVAAEQVGFRPEWVLVGWYVYNTAFMLQDPPTQTAGAFGVGVWNKQPQLSLEPWRQAAVSVGADITTPNARAFYQELHLLAAGIQMAGPRLTPESFAEGLRTTRFPNPGAGGPPSYQGTVGFEDGDAVMVDDYTAFWLDTRTRGDEVQNSPAVNQQRAFCMVGLGRRYTFDTWAREDRFYQGTCR